MDSHRRPLAANPTPCPAQTGAPIQSTLLNPPAHPHRLSHAAPIENPTAAHPPACATAESAGCAAPRPLVLRPRRPAPVCSAEPQQCRTCCCPERCPTWRRVPPLREQVGKLGAMNIGWVSGVPLRYALKVRCWSECEAHSSATAVASGHSVGGLAMEWHASCQRCQCAGDSAVEASSGAPAGREGVRWHSTPGATAPANDGFQAPAKGDFNDLPAGLAATSGCTSGRS